jgi:hypothetical protein
MRSEPGKDFGDWGHGPGDQSVKMMVQQHLLNGRVVNFDR